MTTRISTVIFLAIFAAPLSADQIDISTLKTFGAMGKQVKVLGRGKEAEFFAHQGKGCLTHMWIGGSFKGYERTRIRVYVDGDAHAPWGIGRIGKTGHPSGVYNTYRIPFGTGVRVTAQRAPDAENDPVFFQNGLRLTCRCGETLGDEVLHDPPETEYTTYVWLYQW